MKTAVRFRCAVKHEKEDEHWQHNGARDESRKKAESYGERREGGEAQEHKLVHCAISDVKLKILFRIVSIDIIKFIIIIIIIVVVVVVIVFTK